MADKHANASILYAEDPTESGYTQAKDHESDHGDEHSHGESTGFQLLPPGSVAASAFNLASATLGAGTLALPQAMATTGDVIGVIMLLVSGCATVYSIRLLMIVSERTGYKTYEEIAKNLIGPRFEKVVAGLIIAFCWGTTLVYVVAVGNVLASFDKVPGWPSVFKGDWGHRLLTFIFWLCFMLPLSLAKEINTLRYASLFGMLSTSILVVAIVVHSAEDNRGEQMLATAEWNFQMIQALPIFSFSYCCQTNSFEIYAELKGRSVKKMTFTTAVSMFCCTMIYIVAGISGFADFGCNTDGDILSNYGLPTKHAYIAVAVVAITCTLTMAFPICIFPTRDAVVQLLGYRNAFETPTKIRIAVCAGLATGSIALGLFVPDIDLLFGVLGGIFGGSLGYLLPPLYAWKSGEWTVANVGRFNVIATYALFIGGLICSIGGTGLTLYGTFVTEPSNCPAAPNFNNQSNATAAPNTTVWNHTIFW